MDFQNDPELEKLFKDELDERAGSLEEGARAMAAGEVSTDLAGRMVREGHTIKGTGRVMGYEGIARGGETSELVWRWVQQGELSPSSMLARTLEHLAQEIPGTLDGDEGGVSVAIDTVRALITKDDLISQLPEPIVAQDEVGVAQPDSKEEAPDEEASDEEATQGDTTLVIEVEPATEEPAPGETPPLDADDMADVAATLDKIEQEIAAASEAEETKTDERAPEVSIAEVTTADEPADGTADEATHDEPDVLDAAADVEEPTPEPTADTADHDEPLVFEPGPDGRLPTPTITYEIVSSAFDGELAAATSADQSALAGDPGHDESRRARHLRG